MLQSYQFQALSYLMRYSVNFNEDIVENSDEQVDKQNIGDEKIHRHDYGRDPATRQTGFHSRFIPTRGIDVVSKYLHRG